MTTEERRSIGIRIDRRMAELGMLRNDLARIAGVDYKQVLKWMDGTHAPSLSALTRVCRALKVSSDELLGLDTVCLPEPKFGGAA